MICCDPRGLNFYSKRNPITSIKAGKAYVHTYFSILCPLGLNHQGVQQSRPVKRKGTQWKCQYPTVSLTYRYADVM